jgi:hypothetical protein
MSFIKVLFLLHNLVLFWRIKQLFYLIRSSNNYLLNIIFNYNS